MSLKKTAIASRSMQEVIAVVLYNASELEY